MVPQIVILLLLAITFFLYMAMDARKDPEKRKQFYLYALIDLWLVSVFMYLLVSAILG